MKATIITGAPGSGKTAVLSLLAKRMAGTVAMVDGDNLSWVYPHKLGREWLDLVQDNVAACARNFQHYGIDHFVVTYVLPNRERLGRLERLLRSLGFSVGSVVLRASEDVLVKRLLQRGHTLQGDAELFQAAKQCCQEIRALEDVPYIETDWLTEDQVADRVIEVMDGLTRS